jgi:hypothetical protein
MRPKILVTLFISVLSSCNNQTEVENSTDQTNSDFEKYISTLDQIPLPLEHNPLGELPELSIEYDKTGFKSFKHAWTSQPLGIYYQDEKTVGVIGCSIGDWGLVPFLTIYDLKGNKIDSTGFYHNSGQDIGYESIEYVTFKTDKTIAVLDTIKRWDLNEKKSDFVEGTMKVTTGKVEYQILGDGRIVKK